MIKPTTRSIQFWNDYSLDPNRPSSNPKNPYAEDVARKKKFDVDFEDPRQLYNIIKKRKEFKIWQPSREDKRDMVRALEKLDR